MQLQAYKAAITDIEGVKCQFVQRVWREIDLLREGGLVQADAVEGDILSDFEGLAQAAGAGGWRAVGDEGYAMGKDRIRGRSFGRLGRGLGRMCWRTSWFCTYYCMHC